MDAYHADAATADSVLASPEDAPAVVKKVARSAATLSVERLAALVTAMGGSISDEDHLVVVLQRAVEIAHEAIDGADSCGITIVSGGRTFTAVHTDARTLQVDAHQYEIGEGPCLHAATTGETVRVDVDSADARWPQFIAAAKEEGVRSFLAAPLYTPSERFGSLNIYGRRPDAFTEQDEAVVDALTAALARAIGDYARFRHARDLADGLREALESRAPIEQAKGMLMAIHRIDADAAFQMLAENSQRSNRKLRVVAKELLAAVSGVDATTADETAKEPS